MRQLLLKALPLAGLLAVIATGPAGAQQRTYRLQWDGFQSEAYHATDSTAFDTQRAGLSGCDYTQNGDTTVYWKDIWQFTADVKPRSGHVTIGKIVRLEGPHTTHTNSGDSEISGSNTNEGTSTQCSDEKLAGSYDCTAEKVTAKWIAHGEDITFTSSNEPKAWTLSVPSYDFARADYVGDAPQNYQCGTTAARSSFPGGFVADDFGFGAAEAQFTLKHSDLVGLKMNENLGSTLQDQNSPGWVGDFPSEGDDCSLDGTDEVCTYSPGTTLFGDSNIYRVPNPKPHHR